MSALFAERLGLPTEFLRELEAVCFADWGQCLSRAPRFGDPPSILIPGLAKTPDIVSIASLSLPLQTSLRTLAAPQSARMTGRSATPTAAPPPGLPLPAFPMIVRGRATETGRPKPAHETRPGFDVRARDDITAVPTRSRAMDGTSRTGAPLAAPWARPRRRLAWRAVAGLAALVVLSALGVLRAPLFDNAGETSLLAQAPEDATRLPTAPAHSSSPVVPLPHEGEKAVEVASTTSTMPQSASPPIDQVPDGKAEAMVRSAAPAAIVAPSAKVVVGKAEPIDIPEMPSLDPTPAPTFPPLVVGQPPSVSATTNIDAQATIAVPAPRHPLARARKKTAKRPSGPIGGVGGTKLARNDHNPTALVLPAVLRP